tara:strand:- start:1322 stop:1927 length:606 start_codon:yes stop_codon:yes gene_type:complete
MLIPALILVLFIPSQVGFAQEVPPAIVVGKAHYGGDPVINGTQITAVINGSNVGSSKTSRDGQFTLTVQGLKGDTIRFTISGVPAIESLLLTDNGMIAKMDLAAQSLVATTATPSSTVSIDNSVESNIRDPLGGALIRIFKFHNRDKTWEFYDPDPLLSGINTLKTVHSNEAYWIKVYLDIEVTLNNRSMWLYSGWNLVAY